MKTWITYIAAVLLGLSASLLFGASGPASEIFSSISSYLISLGMFITIPVVLITFSSGVASLMKNRLGRKTLLFSVLWSIVTAIFLSALAAVIFIARPDAFPVTSSAGSAPGTLSSHVSYMISSSVSMLYPSNPFFSIAASVRFILPVVIIAWFLGMALKPSADVIRPAYTTMNSFSEVMYRISRTYSVYGFFIVFFASSSLFMEIYQEKTLFAAPRYATLLAIGVFITIFFVLPLLYGVFTLFRKNPYKMLLRSVSTLLFSFSSSNTIAAIPLAESISRQNLGVQKRISSVSIPLMTIIGKGGSAFVSIIVLLSLYQATTGEIPGTEVIVYTALTAMLVSFISSTSLGTETALITVLTLNILGINLYGAENAIVAFMPLLSGIGSLIDTAIAMLGASVVSSAAGTDIEVPYRDTI